MSEIPFNKTTTLSPEQFVAGLTDDWSDPDHVVLTTTDSKVWRGGSGYTYTLKRRPEVHAEPQHREHG